MFANRLLVHKVFTLATLAGLTLVGCSDSGGGGDDDKETTTLKDLGIDDGASKGLSTSKLVKSTEETTLTLKTGAAVKIPEGALEKDTVISMTRPEDRVAASLVKTVEPNYKIASAPYVLTPHGSKFKRDVDLTLPISKSDSKHVAVAFLEDEKDTTWEVYEAPPAIEGKSATMKVAHFSVLVLLEEIDDGETTAMDAGVSEPDAAIAMPADATLPDASVADASVVQRVVRRFAECQLQSGTGTDLNDEDVSFDTPVQQCQLNCLLNASCVDFSSSWCDTQPSTAYTNCVLGCYGFQTVMCTDFDQQPIVANRCDYVHECYDNSDENGCPTGFDCGNEQTVASTRVCDGVLDCYNGADEATGAPTNCPANLTFACASGQRIERESRCDGYPDCQDGSDEASCTLVPCADGQGSVTSKQVCDLTADCADGSDEPARCLHLNCQPRVFPDAAVSTGTVIGTTDANQL